MCYIAHICAPGKQHSLPAHEGGAPSVPWHSLLVICAPAGGAARLKRKVRSAIEEWERCVARYTEAAHRYVELEDVLHNSDREGMRFQSSAPRRGDEVTGLAASLAGHAEWWWRCRIKPLLFRAGALLTGGGPLPLTLTGPRYLLAAACVHVPA